MGQASAPWTKACLSLKEPSASSRGSVGTSGGVVGPWVATVSLCPESAAAKLLSLCCAGRGF